MLRILIFFQMKHWISYFTFWNIASSYDQQEKITCKTAKQHRRRISAVLIVAFRDLQDDSEELILVAVSTYDFGKYECAPQGYI